MQLGIGKQQEHQGSSNSDGAITSTVSVNTTAGFSIVSYIMVNVQDQMVQQ